MSAKGACKHSNFAGFFAFSAEKACKGTAFFPITQIILHFFALFLAYLRKM